MCGITGFINFTSHNKENESARLKKMTSTLHHRGPDAEGFYVDDLAALGHRRLSIIDISSGSQPMGNHDNTMQIVFNGEIYNFLELKKELEQQGYKFKTESDTEVILNAYMEWGEECVKKFNGMFAFAIWDSKNQKLFLARDRVGKKPLYYMWNGTTFVFASEIKALLAGGFSQKNINAQALDCYFSFGYIPVPFSIFNDIFKLPSAHTLTVTKDGIEKKRYWELTFETPSKMTMNEAVESFNDLLKKAVRCRLMSEVPLGAFLSSGLDSSLVVSFMSEIMDKPVLTNSIGFGDPSFSELPAAKKISLHLKTNHSEFIVEPDAKDTLEKISYFFDEPFADSSALPTWYVCKMARQNVTVVLSGDGGDEGFGGYTFRYIPHLAESLFRKLIPAFIRTPVFSALGAVYPATSRIPKYLRFKTIFENLALSDAEAFYHDLIWLRSDLREKIYRKDFLSRLQGFTPIEMVTPLYDSSSGRDPLSKSQHTDIQFYMTDDVLVKVDRMSMAHSLEVRNPLLDYRILEFGAALPKSFKIHHGKGKILFRASANSRLPASIRQLPKKGFSIPASDWLRGSLKGFAENILFSSGIIKEVINTDILKKVWEQHQKCLYDHSVFIWALMMLGLWEKQYFSSKW